MAGLFTFVGLNSFSGCFLTAACVDNDGALCCCADETLEHQREKQNCITPFFFIKSQYLIDFLFWVVHILSSAGTEAESH